MESDDPRRSKRRFGSARDDEEQEVEPVSCFIPETGIDIEPLAFYIREFVDFHANIRPGQVSPVRHHLLW